MAMLVFFATVLWTICFRNVSGVAGKIPLPRLSSDPNGGDIVVIGDIHSDLEHFEHILHNSGVMDMNGHWKGGKSTLVLLGDYTQGRRPGLKKMPSWKPTEKADKIILDTIARLSEEALHDGGEVIAIQGNHDVMQVLGEGGEYVAQGQDTSEFKVGQTYGNLIAAMPIIWKIGNILFTHGGLGSLQREDLEGTPEEIMQKLQEQNMRNLQNNVNNMSKYPLQHDKSKPTDEILEKLGVEHVIVGHKNGNRVRRVENSALIRVDSEISRAFGDYSEDEAYRRGSHLLLPEGDVSRARVQYNGYTKRTWRLRKRIVFREEDLSSSDLLEASARITVSGTEACSISSYHQRS